MHLYLIRHTPVGVASDLCYGRADVPLHADAAAHIADVCARAAHRLLHVETIVCSTARRCQHLGEALAAEHGVPLELDPRLREFDFGHWEKRSWNDLPREELDRWAADVAGWRPPGGENLEAVRARAGAALDALYERGADHVAVVAHAGVIRALLTHLLGLDTVDATRFKIDYGGIAAVRRMSGYAELLYLNQ